MSAELFFTALVIGLLGAGHCVGMCGGISAALTFSLPDKSFIKKLPIVLAYNLGRIISYSLIGFIAGSLGAIFTSHFTGVNGFPLLRVFAGVMLVLMGLYISQWWRILTVLEKAGAGIWRLLQPLSKNLMPIKSTMSAFLLGTIWGWLPCGLVYSALAFALSQADALNAALVMFAFGLGTAPAIILPSFAGDKLKSFLQKRSLRSSMAILLILYGVWTMAIAIAHASHHQEHDSNHHLGYQLGKSPDLGDVHQPHKSG